MKKMKMKSLLSALLCVMLVLSSLPLTAFARAQAPAQAKLVNIASQCTIDAPENEAGRGPENLVDGDDSTLWVRNGGEWPTEVVFQLPPALGKPVKKVVVKFESGHSAWSVDMDLSYAVNSVITDYIAADAEPNHSFDDAYAYTFETATYLSHLKVQLSNPMNDGAAGAFWPAIAEVEIWVEDDSQEEELQNIAPEATITSVGGGAGVPGNLVDDNYGSLYVFLNGGMSSLEGEPAWVQLSLPQQRRVQSFEIAFEDMKPDANQFVFTYDILGKGKDDDSWTTLVSDATATREDCLRTHELETPLDLKDVRIDIKSIGSTGGDPWPAIAEFKIFAAPGESEEDTESIAWNKPVHASSNQNNAYRINDGQTTNAWNGTMYPGYVDIDLEENYYLDRVEIYTPGSGYEQYSIYTSMDGRDFDKAAEKTSKDVCPAEGETYDLKGKEARIVRVYMEYNSASAQAVLNEVRVMGKPSGTAVQETPALAIPTFEESPYNVEITPEMTIQEVQGIVERRLGKEYVDWFTFELAAPGADGYDYFELSNAADGSIKVVGNNGVSLATGLNYYLKYSCNVMISQVGDQVRMPDAIIPVEPVRRETKFPVRYSYNYCTLSYSMAFWGEEEWRNELDWLALNGVNVVLDATAQEEVWRRFLGELGYSHQEIKDFIAGPAYYAWAYMANLSGFGGPVHDTWFTERTEMARQNQLIMRKLGMQPALQGYSGMVPVDIRNKQPDAQIIPQGTWCSFQRPAMLKTDTATYSAFAEKFYACQREVFGDVSHYYATDPFHEGGNTGGMSGATVSAHVMSSMLEADPDAVWIIQAWQGNPTDSLLQGLEGNREHALVLDLYAEKTPYWENRNEFLDTPWVYCMLNNFGGRMGLHGHIDNFVNEIPRASKTAQHMAGIGIAPEASQNNPVLYDLLFETIWSETPDDLQPIDLDQWFRDYTTRRYGAESDAAYEAMQILHNTVYNPALNMKGQGAPESVVNARPALSISAASTWGNAVIDYNKKDLEHAAELLLKDYDKLKDSPGYQYDLADVLKQVLSNTAQEYQKSMAEAASAGDAEAFARRSQQFLNIIDEIEKVLGTQKQFLVGTWIGQAKDLAANADDFTKELYELNARGLISTWGGVSQANAGGLKDYSNRQWAGLTNDYYRVRWERWINEYQKMLNGEAYDTNINSDSKWFEFEWQWARANNAYTEEPNGLSLQELGAEVLKSYNVDTVDKNPAEDDTYDLPVDGMTATAGSEQPGNEGPARLVLDGDPNTLWHTLWNGAAREDHWIDIALGGEKTVDGLRYLPRPSGRNGLITEYRIELSDDNGATYHEVASGNWATTYSWKKVSFPAEKATNVRLISVNSVTDEPPKQFSSAAEIRVTAPSEEEPGDHTLRVSFPKTVKLFIDGEAQTIPNLIGSYQATVTAGTPVELTFKPAVEGRVFAGVTVNGEAVPVDDAFDIHQYEYSTAMPNADTAVGLAFVVVDKQILQLMVDKAEALKGGDEYKNAVPTVQTAFNNALAQGKVVLADKAAAQKTIDDAWAALLKAIQYLSFAKGDKTPLEEALASAALLKQDDFTSASWTAYEKVLKTAQDLYEDPDAMDKEILETAEALRTAMENLVRKADVESLKALVKKAQEVEAELDTYLEAGQKAFLQALRAAETLLNGELTQNSIDQAATALTETMAALRKIPNKAALEALIKEAESYDLSLYTAESAAALTNALAEARQAMLSATVDQEEVDRLGGNVQSAIDGLRKNNGDHNSSHTGGSGSSSANATGNTYGGEGTAVVGAAQTVGMLAKVISDTTVDFTMKRGSAYCFKMTVVGGNGAAPSFTVGNGGVLKTQFVAKIGNDYYYRVYAIGAPGQSTGVYTTLPGQQPQKHCAITID